VNYPATRTGQRCGRESSATSGLSKRWGQAVVVENRPGSDLQPSRSGKANEIEVKMLLHAQHAMAAVSGPKI
jgi:hypothetical protein